MLSAIASYSSTSVTHLRLWAHLQQPLAKAKEPKQQHLKESNPKTNLRTAHLASISRSKTIATTIKTKENISTNECNHLAPTPKETLSTRSKQTHRRNLQPEAARSNCTTRKRNANYNIRTKLI